MSITVLDTGFFMHHLRSRMPFRYGIATMTAMPHIFVRVTCRIAGQRQTGVAADSLVPKWFTKDPETSYEDDIEDMLAVITAAAEFAEAVGETSTVFELWQGIYQQQEHWAETQAYPPLLWNFGVSLVERAVIDAYCRSTGDPFGVAVRKNTLGVHLSDIHEALDGKNPADFLPEVPSKSIKLRHTVGLTDPLTESDIPGGKRLDDGLPQSLESCIRTYGLTYFKIKIQGYLDRDLERLARIAALFETVGLEDYAFTLDGNEQYKSVEQFKALWESLAVSPELAPFMRRLLFVEQPLHRDYALTDDTMRALTGWESRPAIIIDESDAELSSLARALECGYAGTSHKNCKGVFKGIANACLLAHLRRNDASQPYLLSGEDLTNVGPVALTQDLTVMANLGLAHVERNGHHYFRGLSMFPHALQELMVLHHPDLYHWTDGFATLSVQNGAISLESLLAAPFGPNFELDMAQFAPLIDFRQPN